MGVYNSDELCHYGIQGMKWGIRRFQNKDGSYTTAGKQRYTNKLEATVLSTSLSRGEKIANRLIAMFGGVQVSELTRSTGMSRMSRDAAARSVRNHQQMVNQHIHYNQMANHHMHHF